VLRRRCSLYRGERAEWRKRLTGSLRAARGCKEGSAAVNERRVNGDGDGDEEEEEEEEDEDEEAEDEEVGEDTVNEETEERGERR
jgi:hypothetical protein